VRRRDVLRSIGALGVAGGAGSGTGANGLRESGAGAADTGRRRSVSEGSLRALGELMDEVRPATRLRGNDTPHRRDGGPAPDAGPDEWSEDASHLVLKGDVDPSLRDRRGVRESVALSGAYDFGMAHRREKGLVEAHRFTRGQATDGGHSMRSLVERHRQGTVTEWLVYNTWLAPFQVAEGLSDSDRAARTEEIGRTIDDERYDVALLSEVFHGPDLGGDLPGERIRDGIQSVVDHARGPPTGADLSEGEVGDAVDSGLLGLTTDNGRGHTPRIVDSTAGTFDDLTGQDAPANKGWLHLAVDVGPGTVDAFLTHANSEWDREDPADHFAVRKQNIETVLEAAERHSPDEHVTMVCDDLNVREKFDEFDWLLRRMRQHDLHDVYLTHGGIETTTSYYGDDLVGRSGSGYTDKCRRYRRHCHCEDYVERDGSADTRGERYVHHEGRLDYVFLERPQPEHTFDLDLHRVRRRIFPRYNDYVDIDVPRRLMCGPLVEDPGAQDIRFLSDHMGVQFVTVASPR